MKTIFIYTTVIFVLISFSCKSKKQNYQSAKIEEANSLSIGVAVTTRHLMKLVEPVFSSMHPNVKITSYIHETGNVVNDVIDGKTNLAVTTRNLKDFERERSKTIIGTPIGIDGLVLAVSEDLPITNLTFDEIVAIWTQKITNWKELGGPNLPIIIIGRTKTYDPIKLFTDFMQLDSKEVNGGIIYNEKGTENWSKTAVEITETDTETLNKLISTPGIITYFPLQILNTYKENGNPLKGLSFDGVEATYKSIDDGEYFIHRTLNIITNGTPKKNIKTFIDFILSEDGQQLVETAGFLRLRSKT